MLVPFGEWKPDVSDYQGAHTTSILNVFPRGDGYGPARDFAAYSSALPAACRGSFYARKSDGSVVIFKGTATKLYMMDNTDFTWDNVSKTAGAHAYSLPASATWSFTQFGNYVIAAQAGDPVQYFELGVSTYFANLAGSPPQAAYVSTVGNFVVLSSLVSDPFSIAWSSFGDPEGWTAGTDQSDTQTFPDGGIVRGVAGGEFGYVFQDGAIRTMTYAPGSPVIFQIDRVSEDKGLFSASSIIRAGERVFFISQKGFETIAPGGLPEPIGKERVDRTFFADLDTGNLQLLIGAADPRRTRVMWAYKSLQGAPNLFDRIIVYDWLVNRWSLISISGEYIASLSQPGMTLEGSESLGFTLDEMPFSLDDLPSNATPEISFVNSSHELGFLSGETLEATMTTAEQGAEYRRIFVRGFRPVTDAPSCYGSLLFRESLQTTASQTTENIIDARGFIPQRKDTRLAKISLRVPSSTAWTFAAGIEPDIQASGAR